MSHRIIQNRRWKGASWKWGEGELERASWKWGGEGAKRRMCTSIGLIWLITSFKCLSFEFCAEEGLINNCLDEYKCSGKLWNKTALGETGWKNALLATSPFSFLWISGSSENRVCNGSGGGPVKKGEVGVGGGGVLRWGWRRLGKLLLIVNLRKRQFFHVSGLPCMRYHI